MAEEFGDLFGYNQLIDFPTHNQGNTLDLVFTHCQGVSSCRSGLGTSDHYCIELVLEVGSCVHVVPDKEPTLLWEHAPWDLIRGAVGKGLEDWDPYVYDDVDVAEKALDDILWKIIRRYLKKSKQRKPGPVIWWNDACEDAYAQNQKPFLVKAHKPE